MTATLTTRIGPTRYVFALEPTGIGPMVWTAEADHGPANRPHENVRLGNTLHDLLDALTRENVSKITPFRPTQGHLKGTNALDAS